MCTAGYIFSNALLHHLRSNRPASPPNKPPFPPPHSLQAGCPTVIHVIDSVLVPSLETDAEASSSSTAAASAKASSKATA